MMKSEAYLNEIRGAAGLKRAVLKRIVAEKGTVTFHLVTDLSYTQEDVAYAQRVSEKYAPEGFSAQVRVLKSVPDAEGVKRAILDILSSRFPAAAAFVSPEDIEVAVQGGGGEYFIGVGAEERAQFTDGVLDAVTRQLQKEFCGVWPGTLRKKEKQRGEIAYEEAPPAEPVIAPRLFEICDYVAIDGGQPKHAVYIADLEKEAQGVAVCGRITYIEERQTKSGKPYFSITVNDGTGSLRSAYFTKKATLEKVRSLKVGDYVCLSGDNEIFNGGLSFRTRAMDFGTPPPNFVPVARPSRPAPPRYSCVFPAPASDYVQAALFDNVALPESFKSRQFVVFDLETTGLNNTAVGGTMDRIIEVGAVKIIGGRITEKFSTFVACPVRLSAEIVQLTGIDDSMLVGAPEVGAVMADFFKFCEGSELVGHNVQFDCKFIRHYGEKEGYLFDHIAHDTVTYAQEMLRLPNYKLNTVADHFGFTFNHHRAYDDAFVTAKIFIELVKLKGGLSR